MRNKFGTVLPLILAALFIYLMYARFVVPENKNMLLILAKNSSGIPYEMLEEINQSRIMLTYQATFEKSIEALNINRKVTAIGTNCTYPFVTGDNMLWGGFFTKDDMLYKRKHAVLNKTAAFEIFGSIEITGNEIFMENFYYTVTGVIDDGDESGLNVYVSLSLLNGNPSAVMARLDEKNGVSAEFAESIFKSAGIAAPAYEFINLEKHSAAIREKVFAALMLSALVLLFFALTTALKLLTSSIKDLRNISRNYYFKQILVKNPGAALKPFCAAAFSAAAVYLTANISSAMLDGFLSLKNCLTPPDISQNVFFAQISSLQSFALLSNIAICGFVFILFVYSQPFRRLRSLFFA